MLSMIASRRTCGGLAGGTHAGDLGGLGKTCPSNRADHMGMPVQIVRMDRGVQRRTGSVLAPVVYGFATGVRYACVSLMCAVAFLGVSLRDALAKAPRWGVMQAPVTSQHGLSRLVGVSCTSRTACVAVGRDSQGLLAARWDGIRWHRQGIATPAPDVINTYLTGVSCASTDNCIAVGQYEENRRPFLELPLVERWNGVRWSQQTGARLPAAVEASTLNGVSCISRRACVAVGATRIGSRLSVLIERWDGTRWSIQATPSQPRSSGLAGVSCTSIRSCIAVGDSRVGDRYLFAERWDGTRWTPRNLPTGRPRIREQINGISCSSSRACIAVGFTESAGLAERWDGKTWSLRKITSTPVFELWGVSCTSATACIAVGDAGAGADETVAERWDGSGWKREPTPNPPSVRSGNDLVAVSCRPGLICTAVGSGGHELAEQRAIPLGFTVSHIRTLADGTIKVTMQVPRPGRVDVLETGWKDNFGHAAALLKPAAGRFVFARKQVSATGPGTVSLTVLPNRRGKLLVALHRYRVVLRLWISFTPVSGRSRSIGFYGLRLPAAPG